MLISVEFELITAAYIIQTCDPNNLNKKKNLIFFSDQHRIPFFGYISNKNNWDASQDDLHRKLYKI
jgi:hypothetical protein